MEKLVDNWALSRPLFLFVILLNLADFATTNMIVRQFGFEAEANPFLRTLMEYSGTVMVILWAKAVMTVIAMGAVLWYVEKPYARARVVVMPLLFLLVVYSLIVFNNLYLIYIVVPLIL